MPRTTQVITISLPPEMDEQVRQLMQEEDRTVSGLVREAIRLYMREANWGRVERYGRERARGAGRSPRRLGADGGRVLGQRLPGLNKQETGK